jgi:hypothetical protein
LGSEVVAKTLDDLGKDTKAEGAGTEEVNIEAEKLKIGWGLVWIIVGLMSVGVVLVIIVATISFPESVSQFKDLLASSGADALKTYDAAYDKWFASVKDMAAIWVLVFVPLLTTVIGYIFGEKAGKGTPG